jgi:Zn ribbon nucleic-acid-binding protein
MIPDILPPSARCPDETMRMWIERSLEFVDGCKIGHHHAKCLGPIDSAENLAANSFQFIGDLKRQRKYERSVYALKWNVQPRAVIERNKLCLRSLGFEIHDDVFREGVLSADFEHSEKLAEMALGEFGIDSEP